MGIQTNLGGKTITVDRVDEIFGSEQYDSHTLSVLKSAIAGMKTERDIESIKKELEDATSDGKITPNEKSGLKREWYALQSSWSSVNSAYSNSDFLKNYPSYTSLKTLMAELTTLMDKVFADMDSTYEEADVPEITTNIINAWTLIDNCNKYNIETGALQDQHKLEAVGDMGITDTVTVKAKLYWYKNGAYQDVTDSTDYKDSEFKWYDPKTPDSIIATGRTCTITLSQLGGISPHQFVLEFEHDYYGVIPSRDDANVRIQAFFNIYYGTVIQYAYSDASTIEELKKDAYLQWFDYVKENENGKIYLWRRETSELNKDISSRTWNYFRETGLKGETGKDGATGENGWSQATIQLFRRSDTIPTEKPLALNYAFRTGALTSGVVGKTLLECLNGWSQTVTSGTSPLYVIYASAFNNTETDPIDPNDWTPAAVLSENGTKGENGYTVANVVLYKRFATQPATPSETITYNFYIGTIQGNLYGWSKDFPADDGNPLWVTNATASTRITGVEISTDDKDSISPSEWSTPQIMAKNGAKGDKGDKTYVHIAYANSADGATDFSLTESLNKKYLGQCTDTNATAPTEPSAYKWTKIEGASGKDGESSYVHIAYANSADGTLDFSTSISAGKKYLGQCVDKNADSPTDPTAYKWTEIKGATGAKGDPAPYARQIYIASPTKPSTPTGTADQVPDLWSLQIPARTEKQVIWTSIAVVDVKNGQYVYGTWSEPSKYTPDQSDIALIVEWKWGASDVVNPDEENTTIALEDDTILSVNGQAVVLGTNDTSWSRTIPEQPADKPYLWKREWQYAYIGDDGTEHQAGWVYYCVTGKLGVEGSYQGLGYSIAGSSIIFAGLDTDGKPTLASFRVSINGDAVAFQRKSFNITQDQSGSFHERYFLVAYWTIGVGNLALCYLTPVSETDSTTGAVSYRMKWVAQDGTEIITTSIDGVSYDPYVLADIKVSGASIKSVTLINPTKLKAYETDYFMSLMAQGDMGDINTVAKALDIERVFERLAAMEAFINKLFANQITIMNKIGDDGTPIYGNIHSSGYNKSDYNNNDKVGFFLESTGYAEFKNVFLQDATIQTNDSDGLPILATSIANDAFNFSFSEEATHWSVEDLTAGKDYLVTFENSLVLNESTVKPFFIKKDSQNVTLSWHGFISISTQAKLEPKKITYEYEFTTNFETKITVLISYNTNSSTYPPKNNLLLNDSGIYVDGVKNGLAEIRENKDSQFLYISSNWVNQNSSIKIRINLTCSSDRYYFVSYTDESYMTFMYSEEWPRVGLTQDLYAPEKEDDRYKPCFFFDKKPNSIEVLSERIYYYYIPKEYNFVFDNRNSNDYVIYNLFHPDLKTILFDKLSNGLLYNCDSSMSYIYFNKQRIAVETILRNNDVIEINSNIRISSSLLYAFSGKLYINKGLALLKTKSILPVETGEYDLGSDDLKFRRIYADTAIISDSGTFKTANITGTLSGNVNGNVTTRTNTSAKVWGAVAN